MSEPKAVADRYEEVLDGVYVWSVSDDRLGGAPSSSVAVREDADHVVVINPLRLAEPRLDELGHVSAVILTGPSHARASEHYREGYGAAVWAPAAAQLEGIEPDETFAEGNELPGGLRVVSLAGPSEAECAFLLERGPGVLIVGDAVVNAQGLGGLGVLPEPHNPNVSRTRQSCRKLLDLDFDVMLFAHGDPIRSGARERLREMLGT